MARRFEQEYRIKPDDEVLAKLNRVNQDLDLRVHTVEESTGKLDAAATEVRDRALNYFVQQIDPRFAQLNVLLTQAQTLLTEIETGVSSDAQALFAGLQAQASGLIAQLNGMIADFSADADDIDETASRIWLTPTLKSAYESAISALQAGLTDLQANLSALDANNLVSGTVPSDRLPGRLRASAINTYNTDLNERVGQGFYWFSDTAPNRPADVWGALLVIAFSEATLR